VVPPAAQGVTTASPGVEVDLIPSDGTRTNPAAES